MKEAVIGPVSENNCPYRLILEGVEVRFGCGIVFEVGQAFSVQAVPYFKTF
jgi:hypothetical protein